MTDDHPDERMMQMIDPNEVVTRILAAASAAPDRIAAERAVAPLLAQLRDEAQAMRVEADQPVMLRTWSPDGPTANESQATTAGRLSARLDELKLAKRFGDATDVQRVIDLAVRELRAAALGAAL